MNDKKECLELYRTLQNEMVAHIVSANPKSPLRLLRELSDEDKKSIIPIAILSLNKSFEKRQNKLISVARGVSFEIMKIPFCPRLTTIPDQGLVGTVPLNLLAKNRVVYKSLHYPDKKRSKHKTAHLLVKEDNDLLSNLTEIAINDWAMKHKTGILPSATKYEDWTSDKHINGTRIVSKGDLQHISDNITKDHFVPLNAKQSVGWSINKEMLTMYKKLVNNTDGCATLVDGDAVHSAFSFKKCNLTEIAGMSAMEEKRHKDSVAGKKLLLYNIIAMANNLPDVFYHQYKYDFRGRTYPTTALLHEQGDDSARGLIEFAEKQPLGANGYDWLCYNAASHYGEDKLDKADRIKFTVDNLDTWLSYANDYRKNKDWMKADKPLQFMRALIELKNAKAWVERGNDITDFRSGLVCAIDATTNGAQWMAAISRDGDLGKYVNLTNTGSRGDLYQFMADVTFKAIEDDIKSDMVKDTYTKSINKTSPYPINHNDEKIRKDAIKAERQRKKRLYDNIAILDDVRDWWLNMDEKYRRTATKRITMTTYYSASAHCMTAQVVEDLPMKVDWWYAYYFVLYFLGAMKNSAPAPYKVMRELKREVKSGKTEWLSPVTRFPNKQRYMNPFNGRIRCFWLDKSIRINYEDYYHVDCTPDMMAHELGIVANYVHSLDAAHCAVLTETCHNMGMVMASIHDSYVCMAGDMDVMWTTVRETFVQVAKSVKGYEQFGDGKLVLEDVLTNPYAFS